MASVSKSLLLPYRAEQMFDLVQGIEQYPLFLPWCGGTTVHERSLQGTSERVLATVQINFRGLRHSFTTENLHERPGSIRMRLVQGPFRELDGEWQFVPIDDSGCRVLFRLDYAFANALLSRALAPVFDPIATSFVDAFVQRAGQVLDDGPQPR